VDGETQTDSRFTEREWKALRWAGRTVIVLALAAILPGSWGWSMIGMFGVLGGMTMARSATRAEP